MKQEGQCPAIPAPARLRTACHLYGQRYSNWGRIQRQDRWSSEGCGGGAELGFTVQAQEMTATAQTNSGILTRVMSNLVRPPEG